MRKKSKPVKILDADRSILAELADELFTHLLESNAISDPSGAQIVAAAFVVEQYEKGWRFNKCQETS
jgi:hypothetical protein